MSAKEIFNRILGNIGSYTLVKKEHIRTPEEILEREVEVIRSIVHGAAGYYAPDSDQEKSILGACDGLTTKHWIEPFAKKHPDVKRIHTTYKYWSSTDSSKTVEADLDLYLEKDVFRIVGPWPETDGRRLIQEVWDRAKQKMIQGGRTEDDQLV
jgi:hypothetical protein